MKINDDLRKKFVEISHGSLKQGIRKVQIRGSQARIYFVPSATDLEDQYEDFRGLEFDRFILQDKSGQQSRTFERAAVEKISGSVAEAKLNDLFSIQPDDFLDKKTLGPDVVFLVRINEIYDVCPLLAFVPETIIVLNYFGDTVAKLISMKDSPSGVVITKS